MSNENEQKPDEFDFDMNALGPDDGAGSIADDDFNPFADDAFSAAPVVGDNESIPVVGMTDDAGPEELPAGATDAGDFDFAAFTDEPAEESPFAADAPADSLDDLPAPSSFLTGEAETDGEEAAEELAVPVVEDDKKGKKKDKKEKKKKEKKEKKPKAEKKKKEPKERKEKGEPLELGAIFSLVSAGLLLVALIAANVWTILFPPAGVGFMSTIFYLVGIDLFGLCGILAPVLFYVNRKDIDVFKVTLGVSVMALCLGTIFLMTPLYHYDFDFKGSSTLPSRPIPAAAPQPAAPTPEVPAPEVPAETPAAEEAPAETPAADTEDVFGE